MMVIPLHVIPELLLRSVRVISVPPTLRGFPLEPIVCKAGHPFKTEFLSFREPDQNLTLNPVPHLQRRIKSGRNHRVIKLHEPGCEETLEYEHLCVNKEREEVFLVLPL